MAYFSQHDKKDKAPIIKAICKKHGIKATLAVRNNSTLVLNIKSGVIDFEKEYIGSELHYQVNVYHFKAHFSGKSRKFLTEVYDAMMVGNHNDSDAMTDYFDVGWYVDINIGQWVKPYILIGA
jgi:hypothetical protein